MDNQPLAWSRRPVRIGAHRRHLIRCGRTAFHAKHPIKLRTTDQPLASACTGCFQTSLGHPQPHRRRTHAQLLGDLSQRQPGILIGQRSVIGRFGRHDDVLPGYMQIAQTAQEKVVAYTIGMVPPTTTQDDDGKVIDATGLFGAPAQQSSPPDRPDEPEVYAPRQVASQLLVPGGEQLTGKPPEPDDYFTDLIERQGKAADTRANGSGRKPDHDELDLFFETAAMQAPTREALHPPRPAAQPSTSRPSDLVAQRSFA